MAVPVMCGLIDRRILVNYHVDAGVLAGALPRPFRPRLVGGLGVAGICLIRLKHIRPSFVPFPVGVSSENAAHRIAVEWDENGEVRQGVYITRRDTSSRLNALVGGRLFPGEHRHARFRVEECADRLNVALDSDDGETHVTVEGAVTSDWPTSSVFRSVAEASAFFECGSLGYSATRRPGVYDGLELRTFGWDVVPLSVERVESSYFEDGRLFPAGSASFDSALLMRGLAHEWHGRPALSAVAVPACA
jgi:hypothetical protein